MADPLTVLFKFRPSRRVSIGAIFLDATVEERHEHSSQVTQHPIESGGFVTDHVFANPRIFSVTGEITDSPVVAFSVLGGLTNRRIEARDQLLALYESRQTVKLVTGLAVYTDMVMKTLVFPRNTKTGGRLQFNATFEQIKTADSEVVGIAEQKANPANKDNVGDNKDVGRQEATDATAAQAEKAKDKSILLTILGG